MRIEALGVAFPERVVSNGEVLDLIRQHSRGRFAGDLERALVRIGFFLEFSGAKNRRWIGGGESPMALTERAIGEALEQARCSPDEVDLLIHASVDRRLAEPGQSFFVAKAMGMRSVDCFDILDACNSWTRALRVAQSLLRSRAHRRILVVTSEFAAHEGEWSFANFALEQFDDLDWTFPSYTMGEAATATLLTDDKTSAWHFDFQTRPEMAHLCMCPVDDWPDGRARFVDVAATYRGPRRFVSYAKRMHDLAWSEFLGLIERAPAPLDTLDVVFPHTQSKKVWEDVAVHAGLKIPYYFIYPDYGNIVAGSIPGAMKLAESQGRLRRGDSVAALMAAAGVSFGLMGFRY